MGKFFHRRRPRVHWTVKEESVPLLCISALGKDTAHLLIMKDPEFYSKIPVLYRRKVGANCVVDHELLAVHPGRLSLPRK